MAALFVDRKTPPLKTHCCARCHFHAHACALDLAAARTRTGTCRTMLPTPANCAAASCSTPCYHHPAHLARGRLALRSIFYLYR